MIKYLTSSNDEILKDFQAKKEERQESNYVPKPVEPPKARIDFAKDESEEPKKSNKKPGPKSRLLLSKIFQNLHCILD